MIYRNTINPLQVYLNMKFSNLLVVNKIITLSKNQSKIILITNQILIKIIFRATSNFKMTTNLLMIILIVRIIILNPLHFKYSSKICTHNI